MSTNISNTQLSNVLFLVGRILERPDADEWLVLIRSMMHGDSSWLPRTAADASKVWTAGEGLRYYQEQQESNLEARNKREKEKAA
jgi:hypothetical protein